MESQNMNIKQVIIYAGAFIAFLVGSGFATGQEIMQYFVAYGYMGILGVLVVFTLFLYVGVSFVMAGNKNKFPKRNDVYRNHWGQYIKYRRHTDQRKKDLVNDTDYQFVDETLLESALSEKPVTR